VLVFHHTFAGSSQPIQNRVMQKGDIVYGPWPGKERIQHIWIQPCIVAATAVIAPNDSAFNASVRRRIALIHDLDHYVDPISNCLVVDITYFKDKLFQGRLPSYRPSVGIVQTRQVMGHESRSRYANRRAPHSTSWLARLSGQSNHRSPSQTIQPTPTISFLTLRRRWPMSLIPPNCV